MNKQQIILLSLIAAAVVACSQHGQTLEAEPDSGSGCQHKSYDICWDPPAMAETGVVPVQGNYKVVPAEIGTNIRPLDTRGFKVGLVYSTGTALCADFSADGHLYHCIPIAGGVFAHTHGGRMDGTICPTEGYIISGAFVSPTEVHGNFQYVPSCHLTNVGDFVATLRE